MHLIAIFLITVSPAKAGELATAPAVVAPKPSDKKTKACEFVAQLPFPSLTSLEAFGGTGGTLCGFPKTSYKNDECKPRPADQGPTRNRYASDYVPPTEASRRAKGEVVVTDFLGTGQTNPAVMEAVSAHNKRFEAVKVRLADTCCGNDGQCKSAFLKVRPVFCKPTAQDPCTQSVLYRYDAQSNEFWVASRAQARKFAALKNLSADAVATLKFADFTPSKPAASGDLIAPGRVVFPPYMKGGVLEDDDPNAYVHELTHACSRIRREIAVVTTTNPTTFVNNYVSMYTQTKGRFCTEPRMRTTYRTLFSTTALAPLGMTKVQKDNAFNCIQKLGDLTLAGNTNRVTCDQGCPNSVLEESFAETIALSTLPAKQTIADACTTARDSKHAAVTDIYECIAQSSDRVRRYIREGLECSP